MTEGTWQQVIAGEAQWAIVEGDCLDHLPVWPQSCVDTVLTDPPFVVKNAVELRGKGVAPIKQRSTTIGDQNWSYSKDWIGWAARVCSKHIVAFGGYLDLPDMFRDWGQGDLRGVMVWRKSNAALPAWNVPHYDTEFIVWWGRGTNPSNVRSIDSMVIDCPFPPAGCFASERIVDRSGKAVHPSQKPLEVMTRLVKAFSEEGAIVLDPFMGTGTTGVACLRHGRKFIGIERNPTYVTIARQRLRTVTSAPLFDAIQQGSLFES